MTNQALQTLCQILVAIGILLTAFGGFGAYVYGQRAASDREAKQAAKDAYVGRLEHRSQVLLSTRKQAYPKLELGDSGAVFLFAGPQGTPIFKIAEDNDITVEIEDGELKVSTKIRDDKGDVVAEVVKNEWKVNPSKAWDRNYCKDAIEVRDPSGDVILQIRLVEDRVQFQAKLYDSTKRRIGFGKTLGPEEWGGAIEFTGPNRPSLNLKISPLFKYPSALHLGELVQGKNAT